mmetsp:Transcript_63512/g.163460  ORF Transcript_63512/g.163460 Transcript_63512/m.163460 type:complete len:558 (+) Transcript_63512:125-1798(+)
MAPRRGKSLCDLVPPVDGSRALATANFVVRSTKPSLDSTQKWIQKRIDRGLIPKPEEEEDGDPSDPNAPKGSRRHRREHRREEEPPKGTGLGALLRMPLPQEEVKPSIAPKEDLTAKEDKLRPSKEAQTQKKQAVRRKAPAASGLQDGALLIEHEALAIERQLEMEAKRQAASKRLVNDQMDIAASAFGPSKVLQVSGVTSNARGWKILREYMSEYMDSRSSVPDKVLKDVVKPVAKPNRIEGTKSLETAAAADRAFDQIIAMASGPPENPEAGAKVWTRAKQGYLDLKGALLEIGYKPDKPDKDKEKEAKKAASALADAGGGLGSGLFPNKWYQTLTEELIAELIVDSFTDSITEALLDSAIALVEDDLWGPEPPEPVNEQSIRPPKMGLSSSAPDLRGLPKGSPTQRGEGLTAKGLPMAWNTRKYHACTHLSPIADRIKADTEAQRPKRQVAAKQDAADDQRKFVWPMTAVNFPGYWDDMTKPKQVAQRHGRGPPPGGQPVDEEGDNFLIRLDRNGQSKFPYSLAMHKAFLESQSDPILKEKAAQLAPLRLTAGR